MAVDTGVAKGLYLRGRELEGELRGILALAKDRLCPMPQKIPELIAGRAELPRLDELRLTIDSCIQIAGELRELLVQELEKL